MKCIGIGTFIKDPQIKELTINDKTVKVCQFGLLCSDKRQDSSMVDEEIYLFTVWDKAAEYIVTHASKGTVIFYEAIPKKHKYFEDNELKARTSITFRINTFKLLSPHAKNSSL